ncbi:MAG: HEAT repeat domain-containing protein [bacterium]|nr:HEAT repeat domain-containing protein [bacterium]
MPQIDQLIQHLKDRSLLLGKKRRKKAAEELSKIGTSEVVPHLVLALSDEEADVRKQAYLGLSLLTDEEAIDTLCSLYLESRDKKVWEIITRKNFSPKNKAEKIKFYISTGQTARCIPPDEEEIPCLIELLGSSDTLFLNEATRIISTITEDKLRDCIFNSYFKKPSLILQKLLIKQGWLPTNETKRCIFLLMIERIEDGLRIERRIPGVIFSEYKNLERKAKEILLNVLIKNRSLHPILGNILNIERDRKIKKGVAMLVIKKGEEGFKEMIKRFDDDIIVEIIREKEIDQGTLFEIGLAKGGLLLCAINNLLISRGVEVSDLMKGISCVEKEIIRVNIEAKDKGTTKEKIEAIKILGKTGSGVAIESLLGALEDTDRRIQLSAVSVITRTKPKSILPAVSALFAKQDWKNRVLLAPIIERLADKDASDFLIKAFSRTDVELQEEAIRVLAKMPNKKTVELFIAGLRHTKTKIRGIAASALGKIGDARAIKPLIRTLQDKDGMVRICAAYSLGKIDGEDLFDGLLSEFEKRAWYVKEAGLRAFFRTKEDKVIDYLLELALQDKEKDVRKTAVFLLGKLGQERIKEALVKMLKDKNKEVRLMIGLVLCKLGEDRGAGYLLDTLMGRDWKAQMIAAYGLSLIAKHETTQRIGELMKTTEARVREAAAITIGKTRDEKSAPMLVSAWGGEIDMKVKKRIVEGLGRIRSPKSLSLLELAIAERSPEIREKAAVVIGIIGQKEGLVPLMKALEDTDYRVRRGVLSSIRLILSKFGSELNESELGFIKKRTEEMGKKSFSEVNEWLLLKLQFLILDYNKKNGIL